jgi:hypothetical protein
MRRALVSIGVDRVTGMTPLKVAAFGAKQVAAWGRAQGFDVEEFTDEQAPVAFGQCFNATASFVHQGVYDQIVVYFAGHGQLNGPDQEVWFLTDGRSNPNEAINLSSSRSAARGSGIPHIVFVSDACRSQPRALAQGFVQGGSIFPVPDPWMEGTELDQFFAATPGNPANEIPEAGAVEGYRAIYTECLLSALRGEVSTAILDQVVEGRNKRLVPARKIKSHLAECVPTRASSFSIKLKQSPESRVESDLPKYLAEIEGGPPPASVNVAPARGELKITALIPKVTVTPATPRDAESLTIGDALKGLKNEFFQAQAVPNGPGVPEDHPVRKDIVRISAAVGRENFETGTGFTIHGADVEDFAARLAPAWRFVENGIVNIGVDLPQPETPSLTNSSVALGIQFSTGTGACLAVLPGYVGSLVVGVGGRIESVTYTPSRRSPHFEDYQYELQRVNRRRAFAAVASKNGAFNLGRHEAGDAADYLRVFKSVDPVLGIYAAYAYAIAGNYDGIRSVYHYMSSPSEGPVPFDVTMLAHFDREMPSPFRFPPRMPMLTQGWALLGRHERMLPLAAIEARKYLVPSLWSTFSSEGVRILLAAIRQGAL